MKKINFIFIHSSHDFLILNSLKNENYINNENTLIFIFNTYDKNINILLPNFINIYYLESNNILKKIKFFKIINKKINKYKSNFEINFFASDYLNFISNYFFRLSFITKHLMSHGTANYIDKYKSTHNHKYFYRRNKYILKIFKIIDKFYYRLKQSIILLFCFKIYDPFFLHISGSDRLNFDYGYFYFLENLYTKTKNDILLKFPKIKSINFPKNSFILFLENYNAPSYKIPEVRKLITDKINQINCDTVIHKLHLNLLNKKIKKLNTSKKVILADSRIPAELYIPHDKNIYVIGSETSVLIYAKIINKNNTVICYDNLFKVEEAYRKIYLKHSIEIIDVE